MFRKVVPFPKASPGGVMEHPEKAREASLSELFYV
jgi:hypothetical protein